MQNPRKQIFRIHLFGIIRFFAEISFFTDNLSGFVLLAMSIDLTLSLSCKLDYS